MAVVARWVPVLALAPALILPITGVSGAPSAELAKQCRAMAIKAHPTARPGSAKGSAEAQRVYFQQCVEKEGKMDDRPASQAPK